jgi:O-antigen/teichoic acid export membrane protein
MIGEQGETLTGPRVPLTALWENFRTKVIARKFVQDVGVLTIANVAGAALNVAQGLLVARWLGPELFGVAALVMGYISLVYSFFDAKSSEASVKYLGKFHALGDRECALAMCKLSYCVDLVIACLIFLLLLVTARMAAEHIVHDPATAGLIVIYGTALLPRALMATSNSVLITLGRFPLIAVIDVVTTGLRMVLVVGLVLAGWQVAGVIWANAVAATASGLIYGAIAWAFIRETWGASVFQGRFQALKGARREIFAFFAYSDLNTLIRIIPAQMDALVLGYLRNPTEVGYYKLAKSLSSAVGYVVSPLQSVTYSELARLWGLGYRQALLQKVRRLMLWIGLPAAMAVLVGAALMPVALPLLVGDIYLPAVPATQLLFIASAISVASFWLRPIYLAKGLVREWFIINCSVIFLFASIYPIVVMRYGYMGASGSMLALYASGFAFSGLWLWKELKKESNARPHLHAVTSLE